MSTYKIHRSYAGHFLVVRYKDDGGRRIVDIADTEAEALDLLQDLQEGLDAWARLTKARQERLDRLRPPRPDGLPRIRDGRWHEEAYDDHNHDNDDDDGTVRTNGAAHWHCLEGEE